MILREAIEDKKWDIRNLNRLVTRGILSPDEASQAKSALPDDSDNAEYSSIEDLMKMEDVAPKRLS